MYFSQNSIKFESNLISTAHSYGVKVHPWTFRNENKYLLYDYESDPYLEYEKFYQLGVDGYFTDFRIVIKINFRLKFDENRNLTDTHQAKWYLVNSIFTLKNQKPNPHQTGFKFISKN